MQRESVRSIILHQLEKQHMISAATILDIFRAEGMKVNKTSVYRALDKLVIDGLITPQNISPSEVVYELQRAHHDHFVCTQCGEITSIMCSAKHVGLPAGYVADHHQMTIFGKCPNCS